MKIYCSVLFLIVSIQLMQSQNSGIYIHQLNEDINFDGILDEPQWEQAYKATEFAQVEPNLGVASTESAEVFLIYDAQYVYIGANITYEDPSRLSANVLERDVPLDRDDFIEIHLDTYNDHTNSLVFSTNPLGARYDYEVSRNGDDINNSWNTFWDAKTSIQPNGWSVEMRIPFSSLRYNPSSENVFRFKAVIKYKYKNELVVSTLNETERQPVIFQYKNSEEIILRGLPSLKPLFVTPYVKGGVLIENRLNTDGSQYENTTEILEEKGFASNATLDKVLSNLGLDIKYKPNPNQTLDLTLNTDFAQAEADDRVINVTRFPIFLTEKRLFFLENADLFNSNQFNHRLFHSRRIGIDNGLAVPILGGIRFAGNSNTFQYGILSMQTNKVEASNLQSQNMSVARLKKQIGRRGSYIGFMGTGRTSSVDYNYLTALDGNIRIKDNFLTQFTVASTFDKISGNWKYMYGLSINTFKSNGFGVEYRYRDYSEGFTPKLGFVSRPNTKRITLNHGWRKTYKNHSFLQRLSIGNWLTRFWISSNDKPEFFQTNIYLSAGFKSGFGLGMFAPIYQTDHLFSPWNFADNIVIPQGNYSMWKVEPFFSTGNASLYKISGGFEIGEFYGGTQTSVSGTVNYDFSKNFQTEIGARLNRFKFPESYALLGDNRVDANVFFSRLKFAFTPSSFLNCFFQYDSSQEKIGWNLRFRYTPNEETNLYIVYNHNLNNNRERNSPISPVTDNAGITIKFSKTFF